MNNYKNIISKIFIDNKISEINNIINSLNNNNIINIFTTKFGYYIAYSLKYIIEYELKDIIVNIIYEIDYKNISLHIILFSQKVVTFPKNYIIYQLEQKDISKWIDKKYELSILFSKVTWDYSQSNINKFSDIIKNKINYTPLPLIPIQLINNKFNSNTIPKNNILFFGSMNDIRKNKLSYLQNKLNPIYNIKIINGLYGEKLIEEIINSKIILNIHFYKNAILETARINEILSCNRIVISELPNIIDYDNYILYNNIDNIYFVNNILDMYNKIIELLKTI
jgi:hypothetical protein